MKNLYFFLILSVFSMFSLSAQNICDFEDCETQGYSECFINPYGWDIPICTTDQNHTPGGNYSGLIPDDGITDAIFDLGNQIFGIWGLKFWMYVPTNKEAYWNIQGEVPVGSGEWAIGNIYFNKDISDHGHGFIDWGTSNTSDDTYFDFPHDQWFQIVVNVNISMGISVATWQFGVAGLEIVPEGTAFADGNGNHPSALGGIDFFSISNNNILYLDDIQFENHFFYIGINDLETKGFSFFPNPVKDKLHIKADEAISKISIYNILGQEINSKNIDETEYVINTSDLADGAYIVKVTINDTVGSIKIIK